MVLVVALAGVNAFDAVRLDAQAASTYLASLEKMVVATRSLPDTNGDGEIILMEQDPSIINLLRCPQTTQSRFRGGP